MRFSLAGILVVLVVLSSFPFIDGGNSTFNDRPIIWEDIVPDLYFNGTIGEKESSYEYRNMTILVEDQTYLQGNHSFKNVTLYLEDDADLLNMGNITITDLDDDPETIEDNSIIQGNFTFSGSGGSIANGVQGNMINISNSRIEKIYIHNPNLPGLVIYTNACSLVDVFYDGWGHVITRSYVNFSIISLQGSLVSDTILDNSRMYADSSELSALTFIDSTLQVRGNTIIEGHDFIRKGGFQSTGLTIVEDSFIYLRNLSFSGYNIAVEAFSGNIEILNSSFIDCSVGVLCDNEINIYFVDSEFENCSYPIRDSGLVSFRDSNVNGGTIDMKDHAFLSFRSEFIGMEGIVDIMHGNILNSTFSQMEVGIDSPMGTTITGNIFNSCVIAISSPTGCLIYHNSFIDNLDIDDGIPSIGWYNNELKEGNYYSTYEGSDDGSNERIPNDGIGDTDVPFRGRDLYPFMKDHAWDMPDIPKPIISHLFGTGLVKLSWISEDNIGSFVQRSSSSSFISDLKTWSIKENNISIDNNPNSTQYFRVAVYNEIGFRGWSSSKGVLVDQVPLPPTNILVETIDSGGSLKVSWEHIGEDIERTLILYASRNNTPSTREVFYPMNEVVLDGLDNGVEHSIFLLTEDSSGQMSHPTLNVTGIPVDTVPPPPPKNMRADVTSNISIDLFWDPPGIQDISGYQIYRMGPEDDSLKFIRKVSRLSPKFEDRNLEDNTTYVYGMRTIDDDGPLSIMSELIEVTTFHYNRAPIFNGSYQVISLVEDQSGIEIPVENISKDPDGDLVLIKIDDTERVNAEISGDLLLVEPEKDEAGIGFIKIQATDGEVTTIFFINVLIEEVSDPPSNVRILFPVNGSVFLPGSPVLLRGEAFDADTVHGDYLTYRWISSVDGYLNEYGSSLDYTNVILSPGSHVITMEVFDSNYTIVRRNITIMVSMWGWSEIPWSVKFLEGIAYEDGGKFTIRIENDSPIFLMFSIEAGEDMDQDIFGVRGMIVSASSRGDIDIPFSLDSSEKDVLTITLTVIAESPNGTYAGATSIEFDLKVEDLDEDEDPPYLVIALIVISALIALVGVILFLTLRKFGYHMKVNEKIEKDDANQEDGAKDGKG